MDGDGLDAAQIAARRERGVYALPFYSAEAVYFHPAVIARVASRQSLVLGTDEDALVLGRHRGGGRRRQGPHGAPERQGCQEGGPEGRAGADPQRRRSAGRRRPAHR